MNPDIEARVRAEMERRVDAHLGRVAQAKKIKARRRRLGQSGFAVGSMAVPKKRASHATRNSR